MKSIRKATIEDAKSWKASSAKEIWSIGYLWQDGSKPESLCHQAAAIEALETRFEELLDDGKLPREYRN